MMSSGANHEVAYFSMEIALHPAIPTYAGGLGVLAGDTLRSAADLGVSMVGVSLVHRKGYFRQQLDAAGNQTEIPSDWRPDESLNLIELASAAVPMLIILSVQVAVMGLYAWFITFRFMGRDFDAAVMAGGHCGFGLGATPNAVANMKALVERFGPAPRAFLVLPIVGAFLIDFVNALNITGFLNLLKK